MSEFAPSAVSVASFSSLLLFFPYCTFLPMLQDHSSIRKPWDLKGGHAISNISIRKQIKILYLSLPLLFLLVPLPCF